MILFEKIKARIGTQITGVNVHFSKDGQPEITAITLKNEKGKIKVISSTEEIRDLSLLSENIDIKIPVWLTITGRNVITKKIDKDPGERYLNYVLPNANEADFNVAATKGDKESVFVSAIRTELMTELIMNLHSQNFKILGYSFGPALVQALFTYELIDAKEILIPGYRIECKENTLFNITAFDQENLEDFYIIGNEKLKPVYLLPFTAALNYLLVKRGYDSIFPEIDTDEETYTYGLLNKYAVLSFLAFIFILLLINFLVFSVYNKQFQVLSSELAYKSSFFVKYDSLQSEILMKKKLIEQMRLTDNTKFGFYVDRIAATIPVEITLDELIINKPIGKNRPGSIIEFEKKILITGQTKGSLALNLWIKELKKLNWIREVEIENYENTDNRGEFKLNIIY